MSTTGIGVPPTPAATGKARSIVGERLRAQGKRGAVFGPRRLEKLVGEGKSHQEIADLVFEETGQRVTRAAVTMALKRAGISARPYRYEDWIPWRVRTAHERDYTLAMLRAHARRQRGLQSSPVLEQKLDSWLHKLETKEWPAEMLAKWNLPPDTRGAVVIYRPGSEDGFFLVPRRRTDRFPIRHPDDDEGFHDNG